MKGEGWLLEAGGEGNGEFLPNGYKVSVWDDEKNFFFFLGWHPQHMEIPRLRVESEL